MFFVNAVQRQRASSIDALLLLMVLIWGANYSIVKRAFLEIDPQAFNAVRMVIGSSIFLAVILVIRRMHATGRHGGAPGAAHAASIWSTPAVITSRDWLGLLALGIVGHAGYQYLFVGGLALTTVANSSLILAATPVVIAMINAILGQERIGPLHWAGAALSLTGIYIVVGRGTALGGASFRGDIMMFGAVCCWAVYTLGARQLMDRHSPVGVTGLSLTIGTLIYVPLVWPHLRATDWMSVSRATWFALLYSSIFALCVAYTIWYVAVRTIGSARTSVYSNLIPIVAMLTAVLFLGERFTLGKLAGAAAVLGGVALTRVGKA
ncbi:MAG TPA: DMT family transporter [Vicinamibacterales bacterium]|nr:DMT family transporter [Vicinamibacterales bacterium]